MPLRTATKPRDSGVKGSPFTQYLLKLTPKKDGNSNKGIGQNPNPHHIDRPDATNLDSGDTGETSLERLLTKAEEEASEKVRQKYFSTPTGDFQAQVAPGPKSAENSASGTPSSKSNADNKADYQPSASGTDTDSDSDLSSENDTPLSREKTIKRRLKNDKKITTSKTSKAPIRHLAGWMYHKYPILMLFVTAP